MHRISSDPSAASERRKREEKPEEIKADHLTSARAKLDAAGRGWAWAKGQAALTREESTAILYEY